jgi:hypothetical protein
VERVVSVRCALVVALAGFLGGGGCGRKAVHNDVFRASCDKREVLSQCIDYGDTALDGGRERSIRESCKVVEGVYSTTPCPRSASCVGTCELGGGEVRLFYNEGGTPFGAETAKKACSVGEGVWRPR